ncbi:uncharacterized protein LOC115406105 isoform X3 [Salarias fasciatus]|nr:uncharacterized protein LOC115406105 isoform X3 [Salarias fasciatus]
MKSTLLNITLLRIKEPETEITAIFQYFEAAVGAENTVKLQCSVFFDVQKEKTCPGGHKVLWFTPELNKTHPSVTYIHHVEECDREAELDSPQKCVYNLSQFDIKSSHTGAFYRAVVTSEEMLCGKRLKVEKDNEAIIRRLSTAVSLLSAALVLSLIGIILLLYAMRKNKCVCFKAAAAAAPQDVEPLASPQQNNQTNEDGLVYSVVNFKRNKNSHSSRSGTKSTEDQPNYVDVSNSE